MRERAQADRAEAQLLVPDGLQGHLDVGVGALGQDEPDGLAQDDLVGGNERGQLCLDGVAGAVPRISWSRSFV